ncbi:MAG: hypothetical protein ACLSAH_08520 [Bilophila wadsworthia]
MPVDEAGQHGFAAQVDNFADLVLIKESLSLGIRFEPTKMICRSELQRRQPFCILNVFSFLHRFRNRVDFTIAVYGVSDLVGSVQLHTAARIIAMTAAKDSACFFTRFFMNVPPVKVDIAGRISAGSFPRFG